MLKRYLEIGKIVSTHGIKGEVRVDPWCNSSGFLCKFKVLYFNKGNEELKVLSAKVHKNIVILKILGINSMEQAEKLIGKILYINRENINLSEGEYFIQDIIGIEVFDDKTNLRYGKITDVLKTGANDVYQITDDNNKDYLIPVIDEVICSIDIENNKMTICPLEGIFDDEN